MTVATEQLWRNKTYSLLLVLVFFMHLASYLIIPVFPVFLKKARALSLGQVGLVLGIGSLTYQAGSLLGGPLSDRLGRRFIMITGALLQAGAMLGYHFSESYPLFLFFSGLNGLGVGLLSPTIKAMIADKVRADQRTAAFSWRGIFAHSGIIIAGLTITWMTARNLYPFLLSAMVFLLLATAIRFILPNDRCTGDDCKKTPLSEYRHILRHRSFLLFSAISLLIWAFYAQFALVLPLRGEYVLKSAHLIGLIWTINSVSVVLLQGLISRYVLFRINPYLSLIGGILMVGAGLFGIGFADRFATLSTAAVLFIIGEMLLMPVTDSLVGHFAREEWLGAYFGMANFVSGIGTALGTSIGGTMLERLGGVGSTYPWIVYALATVVLAIVMGLFAMYAMPRHKRGTPASAVYPTQPGRRKEPAK
ncbi:MFS transporter [Brevibacillus ruminantium]|uniref:MFS transporter n=1 Tax=Brevibacillus ruminantium TaxID=2950604 RepID=A0ABY4WJ99_9BACL|nr:MFS transporter [Brevibacillus ruminantium]USG67213.1 MFS transporter [Brevibacillus ruminantium]